MPESPIVWRASSSSPCPVCGGKDACSRTEDGLHFCRRRSGDQQGWRSLGSADHGFHLFRADGGDWVPPTRPEAPRAAPACGAAREQPPRQDWGRLCRMMAAERERQGGSFDVRLGRLAESLGVPAASLDAVGFGTLPVCDANKEECWASPEYDGAGEVVGLLRRAGGGKYRVKGSRNGLSYAADWSPPAGGLLPIVEGATDVAACHAAGFAAIGRPTNTPGRKTPPWLAWLADMIRGLPDSVTPVVVGENDEKDNGLWPGRDGAEATAKGLAKLLGRPVRWCMPPEGVKDVRAWYVALSAAGEDAGTTMTAWLEANARIEGAKPTAKVTAGGCCDPVTGLPIGPPPVTTGPAAPAAAVSFDAGIDRDQEALDCPDAMALTVVRTDGSPATVMTRCGCYSCRACRSAKALDYLLRAEEGVRRDLEAGCVLATFDGEAAKGAMQGRLRKCKNYLRFEEGSHWLTVCSLRPDAPLPCGFDAATPDQAAGLLRKMQQSANEADCPFDARAKRHRPFATSRGWAGGGMKKGKGKSRVKPIDDQREEGLNSASRPLRTHAVRSWRAVVAALRLIDFDNLVPTPGEFCDPTNPTVRRSFRSFFDPIVRRNVARPGGRVQLTVVWNPIRPLSDGEVLAVLAALDDLPREPLEEVVAPGEGEVQF